MEFNHLILIYNSEGKYSLQRIKHLAVPLVLAIINYINWFYTNR